MSSTRRGGRKEGLDVFRTPGWCVRRLLEALPLPGGVWFEPCAGEGAIIRAVQAVREDVQWGAAEIRPNCRGALEGLTGGRENVLTGDYLSLSTLDLLKVHAATRSGAYFDVLMTNPPFWLAQKIVEASLDRARDVLMFLRLNFMGADCRVDFMRKMPPDLYILPERPVFENGKTDSIVYAWFHWPPLRERPYGRHIVLAPTPKEERLRDRKLTDSWALPATLDALDIPLSAPEIVAVDADLGVGLGTDSSEDSASL
jgi:hypothetical protein